MLIATPFGLCEFLSMTFGLKNGGQALQRLKSNILIGQYYDLSFLDDDGVQQIQGTALGAPACTLLRVGPQPGKVHVCRS